MSINIIQKARDLLNLRDKAATQGEAEAAAFALGKLISKHRLSIAELESKETSQEFITTVDDNSPIITGQRIPTWKRLLIQVLSKHYNVVSWWRRRRSGRGQVRSLHVCGTKEDIEAMRFMFNWLLAEITRLSRSYGYGKGQIYYNSYRLGFIQGIKFQLDKAHQEAAKEYSSSVAMILHDRYQKAHDELAKMFNLGKAKTMRSNCEIHRGAYLVGLTDGEHHHLGKSLEEDSDGK